MLPPFTSPTPALPFAVTPLYATPYVKQQTAPPCRRCRAVHVVNAPRHAMPASCLARQIPTPMSSRVRVYHVTLRIRAPRAHGRRHARRARCATPTMVLVRHALRKGGGTVSKLHTWRNKTHASIYDETDEEDMDGMALRRAQNTARCRYSNAPRFSTQHAATSQRAEPYARAKTAHEA